MAQSGYTPIILYSSSTALAAPIAGNLAYGEIALNYTDGKLYYKNNLGVVTSISGGGGSGTVTSVGWTGGLVTISNATTTPAFTIAGTPGGLVYFDSATSWSSSGLLASNGVVYGSGTAAPQATAAGTTGQALVATTSSAPTWGIVGVNGGGTGVSTTPTQWGIVYAVSSTGLAYSAAGTTGQVLTANTGAAPTWTAATGGTVTTVGWTGGIVTVTNNTTTPAFTIAGTSGGIPYFSSTSTWATSALLTQYGVVYGGGAGASPVATAAGTTGQVLTATTSAAPTWANLSIVAGTQITSAVEFTTQTATTLTGTVNYDVKTQAVYFVTANAAANWILNVRGDGTPTTLNSFMAIGQAVTFVLLVTQGTTAYYQTSLTIDGNAQTVKWQGGSAPSAGNASSTDAYTFTIIKTAASTYTCLGALTKFA